MCRAVGGYLIERRLLCDGNLVMREWLLTVRRLLRGWLLPGWMLPGWLSIRRMRR